MSISHPLSGKRLRPRSLAACIALACASSMPACLLAATTHVVTTCADAIPQTADCSGGDDGTLRKALQCAGNKDTVDLTQLQCSKITLAEALIAGPVTVTVNGPGRDKLTIDAAGHTRALIHNGTSKTTIYLNNLTIANGRYENTYTYGGGGGCIYSAGSVTLASSTVTSCYSSAYLTRATGGAIFAKGRVYLKDSTVTLGVAYESGGHGSFGGGVYASQVLLTGSTVGNNRTVVNQVRKGPSEGGGIWSGDIFIKNSTVYGNEAGSSAGGIMAGYLSLTNSTVSGNFTPSDGVIGGIYVSSAADIRNSTIVDNRSGTGPAGGLYVRLSISSNFFLFSTIIAGNTVNGIGMDLGVLSNRMVNGGNNFIGTVHSGMVPADTLFGDPQLGPLRDNGGPMLTHAPLRGSPVIDAGSNLLQLASDQRGFPRVEGNAIDIGAVESDFLFGNGFDP